MWCICQIFDVIWHLSFFHSTYGTKFCFLLQSRPLPRPREWPGRTHARTCESGGCASLFARTSAEIDEGLYLRRGTSYDLTSCVFRVMPRDLIVLLIINRERRYTSRDARRRVAGCLSWPLLTHSESVGRISWFFSRFFRYYKRANWIIHTPVLRVRILKR